MAEDVGIGSTCKLEEFERSAASQYSHLKTSESNTDEQAPFVMLGSLKVTSFKAFSMCTQVMTALYHDDTTIRIHNSPRLTSAVLTTLLYTAH